MKSESLLPRSQDPVENTFNFFGFSTSGGKSFDPSLDRKEKCITFNKILMRVDDMKRHPGQSLVT